MIELVALLALLILGRVAARRFFRRITTTDPTERCPCGYALENLSVPRCPKCGRVIGFHATAEELGLSDEELKRAQFAREKRKGIRS